MRRRLWLLLCALGVLGTAACGAGEGKANAAAKSKVVKSSAAAATGEASKAEEKESESSAAKTATTEPAMPASTAESTASETAAVTEVPNVIQTGDYLCFQSSLYTYGEFQRDMAALQKNAGAAFAWTKSGRPWTETSSMTFVWATRRQSVTCWSSAEFMRGSISRRSWLCGSWCSS